MPARILIVDDEEPVRDILSALLERNGYSTTAVQSSEEAMARLRQGSDYDLVLSDIMMPGTNGLSLLEQICLDHPEIPVVMCSALNDINVAINAFRHGAIDYLLKPFERAELENVVTRAIEQSHLRRNMLYRYKPESIMNTSPIVAPTRQGN